MVEKGGEVREEGLVGGGGALLITVGLGLGWLTPHLLTAETLGSGHFSPLFVPDPINAILSTFVELYSLYIER